jgi:hypothetical protein
MCVDFPDNFVYAYTDSVWNFISMCQKRPTYVSKETYMCQKRPALIQSWDVISTGVCLNCISTEVHTHKKYASTYVRMHTQTYIHVRMHTHTNAHVQQFNSRKFKTWCDQLIALMMKDLRCWNCRGSGRSHSYKRDTHTHTNPNTQTHRHTHTHTHTVQTHKKYTNEQKHSRCWHTTACKYVCSIKFEGKSSGCICVDAYEEEDTCICVDAYACRRLHTHTHTHTNMVAKGLETKRGDLNPKLSGKWECIVYWYSIQYLYTAKRWDLKTEFSGKTSFPPALGTLVI